MTYRLGDVSGKAASDLAEQGLPLPVRPESALPGLPDSLADMSDVELMDSYAEFVAWSDYTTTQAAIAAVDERVAQAQVDALEAQIMLRDWTGKGAERVTLQRAKAAADPDLLDARSRLDERYAYRKLTESIASAMERNAAMLSRELTRRTSTDKTTRRSRHT